MVCRLSFAPSVKSARQMVAHGNVLVNVKRVTIGSQVLRPNDQIALESYQHVS